MNLLTIKTMNDGSIIRSLLNYETENGALCAFYNELAYAVASPDIKGVMVELITDDGHVKKCERFNKPVEIAPVESEGVDNE